ncbi:MAG: cob(I)yrinic acid a,c-diamide adenosyltransferase [Planctomycetota bacterium]|nr:cob(I)yrinic acid a,c-diamide adenosyltransferase [Planctomycetota bacterium]
MVSAKRKASTPQAARGGILTLYTGNGKGKTTAALGAALRAIGHGRRVLMVQFIKGAWRTGEQVAARKLRGMFKLVSMGAGFVRSPSAASRARHVRAAESALRFAVREGATGRYGLVILDELNCAVSVGLLGAPSCLEAIRSLLRTRVKGADASRSGHGAAVNVIVTGRGAPGSFVRAADTVSEMCEVKHPYHAGVPAQAGIDF